MGSPCPNKVLTPRDLRPVPRNRCGFSPIWSCSHLTRRGQGILCVPLFPAINRFDPITMLQSSYSELERKASVGRVLILAAILLHLTASVLSMAALRGAPVKMVIPLMIQLALCAALLSGRNWARWILIALNSGGGVITGYLLFSGTLKVAAFYAPRIAVCAVVVVLLLLPASRSHIQWKNLRF